VSSFRPDRAGRQWLLGFRKRCCLAESRDQYRETDERFVELVGILALADDGWLARFLTWLRGVDELASAAIVGSSEWIRTRLANGLNTSGGSRSAIDSAFTRADQPGQMLAYWFRRYGRTIPKPIRHGLADAATPASTTRPPWPRRTRLQTSGSRT
jgi:hypothetical protein